MSFYAMQYAASARPFGTAPQKPARKSRFNVSFTDLVRPDGFWPQPYSLEQAFEIFRWMVKTGSGYTSPTRWGQVGVKALLSATSANDAEAVTPIRSIADLRERFQYAILGFARSEAMALWRAAHRVEPGQKVRIGVPVYTPFAGAHHLGWESEADIAQAFTRLTGGHRGQALAVSLNSVWPDVRHVHGVTVAVRADGFRFQLTFGDDPTHDRMASSWTDTLAVTRPGESFLDTFARARDVLAVLLTGEGDCDADDFLQNFAYGCQTHAAYVRAFMAGDRTVAFASDWRLPKAAPASIHA